MCSQLLNISTWLGEHLIQFKQHTKKRNLYVLERSKREEFNLKLTKNKIKREFNDFNDYQ